VGSDRIEFDVQRGKGWLIARQPERGRSEMAREAIAERLARSMLANNGVSIIWKLHSDAATLYRAGNSIAAESFLRIADAAEREWLRREPAHA
jgi:hypothetical protein